MLCHLCETFLTNVFYQDFSTWRLNEQGWFTFKHGNYADVHATAKAGCEMCSIFNGVRTKEIENWHGLNDKWHADAASIDAKPDHNQVNSTNKDIPQSPSSRWTFQLVTVAPKMSWISFELFEPTSLTDLGNYHHRGDMNFPLAVPTTSTSNHTISMVKTWMDDHSTDTSFADLEKAPLPTRVIEIGYSDSTPTPRLQVNRGQLGRYVTLSHCWGTGNRLTLTKNNLSAFQQAIPFHQLSRTFQDAIRLSMSLGVRYLWIDALCIVQDDRMDWRRESASMGAVFENAVFSISALAAEDSHSGMLHDRPTPSIVARLGDIQCGVRARIDSLPQALKRARLETRAWCYQERLMSKAVLWVAPDQMHWEGRNGSFSEALPWRRAETTSPPKPPKTSDNSSSMTVDHKASASWVRIVSEYSSRHLTKPSDRLPAIAGLADRFQKRVGNAVYMQGIWSNDFHAQLLWRRRRVFHGRVVPSRDKYPPRASLSTVERPRQAIASTYSWASLNDAVEYPLGEQHPLRRVAVVDAVFEDPRRTSQYIGVEGLLKRGSCKTSATNSEPDQATFRPSGSLLVDDGLTCFLDFVDEPVGGCYCLRIANWNQSNTKPSTKKNEDSEKAAYLILEKSTDQALDAGGDPEQSTFKRIGMGFDVAAKVDKIFTNAVRQQLRLV